MKNQFETRFKATIKVGGKVSTFAKSADSVQNLIKLIKAEGLSVTNIVSTQEFKVSVDKQRGRTSSKY